MKVGRPGLILALALMPPGCASVVSPKTVACADPASAECRANQGDKAAQLALGRTLEMRGGREDLERAAKLYAAAGRFTSGTQFIYSPAVGRNGRAMVLPVRSGPDTAGLPEAIWRLSQLYAEGRGVAKDPAKAYRLAENACAAGVAAACTSRRP